MIQGLQGTDSVCRNSKHIDDIKWQRFFTQISKWIQNRIPLGCLFIFKPVYPPLCVVPWKCWNHTVYWKLSLSSACWEEVTGATFSDSYSAPTPLLSQNFWIRVRKFFKFEIPIPVQITATFIDLIEIYPCFYLRNDHIDTCYCRNCKGAPDPGPVFHKLLTPGRQPGPKVKRRILPVSTPALRIHGHLCLLHATTSTSQVGDAISQKDALCQPFSALMTSCRSWGLYTRNMVNCL